MLKQVSLTNFRNYKQLEIDLNAELVLIVGLNAAGKTNFLESVYYLSRLKSFRAPDNLLVSKQEDYFKIAGQFADQKLEAIVQIYPRTARSYKIDEQKIRKVQWKTYATVLFEPQDLNLFELGPALRRKYLNQVLSQINLSYALDLVTLEHVLKQRSALFQQIYDRQASVSDLEIWNLELGRVSVNIYQQRKQLAEFIDDRLTDSYNHLTDFPSKLNFVYQGSDAATTEEFLEKLRRYADAEIRSGQNLYGPHRDDFVIEKDSQENLYNSSRGELRSQVLALKMLQAQYLDEHQLKPIILLDDVFSELDEIRRSKLITSLSGRQIFITTTEEHHLPAMAKDTQVLKVSENNIKTAS